MAATLGVLVALSGAKADGAADRTATTPPAAEAPGVDPIVAGSGHGAHGAPDRVAVAADYALDVWLDPGARSIAGVVTVTFTNPTAATLDRAVFDLYPNRFATELGEVTDVTRAAAYPTLDFVPGGIAISTVEIVHDDAGIPAAFAIVDPPGLPAATALEVTLARPLPPGAHATIEISFATLVPERYGPFGATREALTAIAGWYPYLAALDASGGWSPGEAPDPARIAVDLTAPTESTVVLGDAVFAPGHAGRLHAEAAGVRTFAAVAYPAARVVEEEKDGTHLTFVSPVVPFTQRHAPGPGPEELVRATVASALARRASGLEAPASLTVIEVPLRWNLTTPADGLVVLSDRAMHVQELLRGFHDAQIAQAVYAELLRERVFRCEAPADRQAVQQAAAWALADAFVRAERPEHRDVHWYIDWFDVFAIVDRFEFAPKVPFVQTFFPNAQSDDDLRESVFTWGEHRAPPRLVVARLDRAYGAATLAEAVDAYAAAPASRAPDCVTFADALASASGRAESEVAAGLAAARVPPPTGMGAIVDPELRPARERSRYQLVLDTADVEVSSTEFGLAALFVARRTHDYSKDFAINPFFTERSYGVHAGPRFHFGRQLDAVTYAHNLFGFYKIAKLDRGFKDNSEPELRTSGEVGAFGLRYDYANVFWYDNPTDQRTAHLFVDWADQDFGGDWDFVRFGGRASATTPLLTHRTIGAIELLAGFEEPTSNRGVPIQEQYSLGGRRALRGVSVNDRLARNIGLARFEIRQDILPEWDLNLLDIVTYRRPQVKLFVDTGQVDDSAGRALNPEHWAIAGGLGVNALYDFLGFFPGRAYVEVGTRFDREQTEFQFLFGTRQAF